MSEVRTAASDRKAVARWLEFVALFIGTPVAMALFMPPTALLGVLAVVTAVGAVLLHFTPGFRWEELLSGWRRVDLRTVATFGAVTVAVCTAVLLALAPEAFFNLPRYMPLLTVAVLLVYPLFSALPQELLFRPLFFRRYASLLPSREAALVVNAAIFSLAHLMFWSWVVFAMTFVGGLVFAWAYEVRRSFALAVVLHSVSGNLLFVMGLDVFFYSGNVERPF